MLKKLQKYKIFIFLFILCIVLLSIGLGFSTLLFRSKLKVITWNTLMATYNVDERHKKIIEILHNENPDVIALQEINVSFFYTLKKEFPKYEHNSYCEGSITFSKYPILYSKCVFPPTLQIRPILIVDLLVEHTVIRIINVHLDSFTIFNHMREKQIDYINKNLLYENTILLGDFNFNDTGKEWELIQPEFIDIWRFFYPDIPGYTWDIEKNKMAYDFSERIDLILCKGNLIPINIKMIGTEPFKDNLWPSDHFGLVTEIMIKEK